MSERESLMEGKDERNDEGAALYEYALVFSLFCLVISVIVSLSWYWWNMSWASVALHDGARDAAARNGDLATGRETTERLLIQGLGRPNAEAYDGHWKLWLDGSRRSVRGELRHDYGWNVPFIGETLFKVRASTFQRQWQFYGGPPTGPEGWE